MTKKQFVILLNFIDDRIELEGTKNEIYRYQYGNKRSELLKNAINEIDDNHPDVESGAQSSVWKRSEG